MIKQYYNTLIQGRSPGFESGGGERKTEMRRGQYLKISIPKMLMNFL